MPTSRITLNSYVLPSVFTNEDGEIRRDIPQTIPSTNEVSYGDNFPDWRLRIAEGRDATTFLDGTTHRIERSLGHFAVDAGPNLPAYRQAYARYQTGVVRPAVNPSSDNVSSDILQKANNLALQRFLRKLMNEERQFQSGIFLGELRETLRMIKTPVGSLRRGLSDYYRYVKKHTRRAPRQTWDEILGNTWLEYSFGWRPFIQDIDEGAAALADIQHRRFARTLKSAGDFAETLETGLLQQTSWELVSIQYRFQRDHTAKVIYRGQIAAEPFARRTIGQRLGFTLEEFVPTVWELMPWSFLIDYFTNVGDVLAGWSYGTGQLGWANKTQIVSEEYVLTHALPNASFYSSYNAFGWTANPRFIVAPKYKEVSRQVIRDKYVDGFRPDFQWEFPELLSKKWLNIAALITGREWNSRGRFSPRGI